MIVMPWTKKKLEKIALLPDEMRERGEYLLMNPRLGRKVVGKTNSGRGIFSNCWATTVFMEGEESIDKCRKISERMPFLRGENTWIYSENNTRPGRVEYNVMREFLLENYHNVKHPLPGDIAILEEYVKGAHRLYHTGTWTGVNNTILSQNNSGGIFRLEEFPRKMGLGGMVTLLGKTKHLKNCLS